MSEKIIHVHIWDASKPHFFYKVKKSERSELHIYKCSNTEGCDAFKNGQCINVGNVFGERCPNGSRLTKKSVTVRANSHSGQVQGWKDTYKEHYNALNPAPKKITRVTGGWMMPYDHITQNKLVPFKSQGGLMLGGCSFLSEDEMTKENMISIINNRPQAAMGGEISSYQNKIVPKFIFDFKSCYPDIFNELLGDNEKAKAILESMDFVGRVAYIKTVKPGSILKFTHTTMHWDGKKLTKKDSKMSAFDVLNESEFDSAYFEYVPKDTAKVKITDNNQVYSETRFAD